MIAACADVVPGYVRGAQFDAHELLLSILDRTASLNAVVDCRLERTGQRLNGCSVISLFVVHEYCDDYRLYFPRPRREGGTNYCDVCVSFFVTTMYSFATVCVSQLLFHV